MTDKHTAERLAITDRKAATSDLKEFELPEPTTQRIFAALSACEGIPTAALEAGVVGELVAALQPFADQAETFDSCGEEFVPDQFEPAIVGHTIGDLRFARATLSKAKGGQP